MRAPPERAALRFVPLTVALADTVAPWFDDPDTQRYLGGRNWLYRELELIRSAPQTPFRGRRVLARHVWIAHDELQQPCALVDLEPYDDGEAGLAFLVAPTRRGRGIGPLALMTLEHLPELGTLRRIVSGVEPDNLASQRCLRRAGYEVAGTPDAEGLLTAVRILPLERRSVP